MSGERRSSSWPPPSRPASPLTPASPRDPPYLPKPLTKLVLASSLERNSSTSVDEKSMNIASDEMPR
jgi:hypothetical protein